MINETPQLPKEVKRLNYGYGSQLDGSFLAKTVPIDELSVSEEQEKNAIEEINSFLRGLRVKDPKGSAQKISQLNATVSAPSNPSNIDSILAVHTEQGVTFDVQYVKCPTQVFVNGRKTSKD
jgi:hypothetical protein